MDGCWIPVLLLELREREREREKGSLGSLGWGWKPGGNSSQVNKVEGPGSLDG